jgi:predicted nucleic acid-binding protein
MKKPHIFLDSSALFAGVISATGAARVLLELGEYEDIDLSISEFVVLEAERSLAIKSPHSIPHLRNVITKSIANIIRDPSPQEIRENLYLISDPNDVPILLSAMKAKADFLATHNRKHFLDDPKVAELSQILIGTPGDALAWVREYLAREKP